MNIVEYFDEYNPEHIAAWRYLSENGHWSLDFQVQLDDAGIDAHRSWPVAWQVSLAGKMAEAWVQSVIDRNEMR